MCVILSICIHLLQYVICIVYICTLYACEFSFCVNDLSAVFSCPFSSASPEGKRRDKKREDGRNEVREDN